MIQKIIIKGLVQGIGFRPFVAKIADQLNIEGWVRNTGGIVTVLAKGDEKVLGEFLNRIKTQVPTGGFITNVEIVNIDNLFEIEKCESFNEPKVLEEIKDVENKILTDNINGFHIIESDKDSAENLPLIPADIATCPKCQTELLDSKNRRYMHPFISCTVCGPRYSIIEKLPYDRDIITMGDFEMCPQCKSEYEGKVDRRRHAQTIACHDCGPKLEFTRFDRAIAGGNVDGERDFAGNLAKNSVHRKFTSEISDNVSTLQNDDLGINYDNVVGIIKAKDVIVRGGVVAVKDIGGYHLVCDPFNGKAVAALRKLKHREEKAFAVMFKDVEEIRRYGIVNTDEEKLLNSSARPIVLIQRRNDISSDKTSTLAGNVCLTSPSIGAMLPCNPLQIMLVNECGPLIMTSGNASGDVLEINNEKMAEWLETRVASGEFDDVPIAMLSHDRRILRPMDDSVMKVVRGRQQFIRRGRGHVPNPIAVDIRDEIFAAGGDLKSTFCYVKNGLAYVSQHLGDLESVSCQKFYKDEQKAMKEIFGFNPTQIAADKHPGYFSSRQAQTQKGNKFYQHHKAHVAAVIAEHDIKGQVLGFAFDGTGYGDDGTVWGGEVFKWDGVSRMDRVAHLKPVKLIGGDEGAKNCDTILAAMLHDKDIDYKALDSSEMAIINAALDNNINTVTSSSMGRLFDAAAALLDICHYNTYEGQAPVELENIAHSTNEYIPLAITEDGDTKELFRDIVNTIMNYNKNSDTNWNEIQAKLARGFIYAVSDYICAVSKKHSINQIVLSGGTFLNRILLERTIDILEKDGFTVYIANELPAGDGGLCLGQAFLAGVDSDN